MPKTQYSFIHLNLEIICDYFQMAFSFHADAVVYAYTVQYSGSKHFAL